MWKNTAANMAVSAPSEAGGDTMVLALVLGGVAAMVLVTFVASKLAKNDDPEVNEEYPLPLDDFDRD